MSKTALLSVKILADATKAAKTFDETEGRLNKLGSKALGAAQGMTAASAGITAFAVQAFESASSLQQSTGAIESIYKEQAEQIKALAADADQAVGLSANSYQELASVMGAQLKNMGVSSEELVGQTDELIKKGADLAATFGGSTADAVGALSSLMKGETDPIERYGISIKESTIQAELAAQGLDKLEGEAAKQARTQAILTLLNQQSADAIGAFAREADTAAGQQQRATAAFEDAKAALGEALLPVIADVASHLATMASFVEKHPKEFQAVAIAVVAATAALWGVVGVIKAWKAVTIAMTAAQAAMNLVMAANPITLIILAVLALVAALVYFFTQTETGKAIWEAFTQSLANAAAWLGETFTDLWNGAVEEWDKFTQALDDGAKWVEDTWNGIWESTSQSWDQGIQWIEDKTQTASDIITGTRDLIFNGDFTGTLANALGIEEDNIAVDAILDVHDAIDTLGTGWSEIWTAFQGGDDGYGALSSLIGAGNAEFVVNAVGGVGDAMRAMAEKGRNAIDWALEKWREIGAFVQDFIDLAARPGDAISTAMDLAVTAHNRLIQAVKDTIEWIDALLDRLANVSLGDLASYASDIFAAAAPPDLVAVIPNHRILTAAAAPRSIGKLPRGLQLPRGLHRSKPADYVTININGVINADDAAREIKRLLADWETRQSW